MGGNNAQVGGGGGGEKRTTVDCLIDQLTDAQGGSSTSAGRKWPHGPSVGESVVVRGGVVAGGGVAVWGRGVPQFFSMAS